MDETIKILSIFLRFNSCALKISGRLSGWLKLLKVSNIFEFLFLKILRINGLKVFIRFYANPNT